MDKIPKVIHCCWFGRGYMPELALNCIESWKKNLPNYKIKMWNEDNFDINQNRYVKEAYEAKKYAFVTDYVRLYVLYNEGGIYMDTDVQVIKSLDEFLHYNAFSGFQTPNEVSTGLMAAKPRNNWIKMNLIAYENKRFIKSNGSYDMIANVSLITEISKKMGLREGGKFQIFDEGVAIYPIEYFCAKDYRTGELNITDSTYAIHHFAGSWLPESSKFKLKIREIIGDKNYNFIKNIVNVGK